MPENQQEATRAIHKGTEDMSEDSHTQKGVGMGGFSVTHIGVFIKLRSIYPQKIYGRSCSRNCDKSNLFITIRFSLNILCPAGQHDLLLCLRTSEFYSAVASMFSAVPKLSRSAVPL